MQTSPFPSPMTAPSQHFENPFPLVPFNPSFCFASLIDRKRKSAASLPGQPAASQALAAKHISDTRRQLPAEVGAQHEAASREGSWGETLIAGRPHETSFQTTRAKPSLALMATGARLRTPVPGPRSAAGTRVASSDVRVDAAVPRTAGSPSR